MQIKKKLQYSIFIITFGALLFISLVSCLTFFSSSQTELKANTGKSLARSSSMIEDKINEIDIFTEKAQFFSKSSYDLMADLKKYSSGRKYSMEELFFTEQEVRSIFKTLLYRMDNVNFSALILPDGQVISYSNSAKDFAYGYNPLQDEWYYQTIKAKGNLHISEIKNHNFILNSDDQSTLIFSRVIYDFYTKEALGVLVVNTEPNYFDFIAKDFPAKVVAYQLSDEESHQILYQKTSTSKKRFQKIQQQKINTKQSLLLSVTVDNSEYILILLELIKYVFLTLIVVSILTLYISARFSKSFTKPIVELSRIMSEKTTPNHSETVAKLDNRQDEIGFLYKEFNRMLSAIERFTKEQIEYEQSLAKSELNVYKNQIDSHFLYNSLESINSIAEIEEIDDISTISLSLSNMFRYASNGFVHVATLNEELNNVEEYLNIQKIRFQKSFDYEVNIKNKKALSLQMPKIILQPLVENAIYHGLNRGGIDGKIRVYVSVVKESLLIRIYDNGIGLSENDLKSLNHNLNRATILVRQQTHHIGLINIQARIQNAYGNFFGLKVFSTKNKGCLVRLRLPLIWEDENDL